MKRTLILCLYLVLLPSPLMSENLEEKRRIEEIKRESLKPSEVRVGEEKEAPSPASLVELAYFTELTQKRITFRYDACRLLVLLMGVEEQYLDLDSQVAFIKEKNLLPKKYALEFSPMEPLRKGLAAYMFCKLLNIKGGITLRYFGISERYALKELAFEGIMPSGNVKDIVSGEELISAFIQTGNYMAKKQGVAPSALLDLKPKK